MKIKRNFSIAYEIEKIVELEIKNIKWSLLPRKCDKDNQKLIQDVIELHAPT